MTARPAAGTGIREFAPAKINLTLEVLGRRADGYHELVSLVAFAGIGDRFALDPASDWSLDVTGPMATAIDGENIVDRAAHAVSARWSGALTGKAELYKELPVAAGIGGGSTDAAAALRALRRLNTGRPGEPDWSALARSLGADVPVCLVGRLAVMRGLGELVEPLLLRAALPTVLVNPGTKLSTARVFADLAAPMLAPGTAATELPLLDTVAGLLDFVCAGRNDLEPSALRLAPEVGRVRAALQAAEGCQVARLSGSGPTCFGLFATEVQARRAAEAIADAQPDWWVRATTLS